MVMSKPDERIPGEEFVSLDEECQADVKKLVSPEERMPGRNKSDEEIRDEASGV